MHMPQHVHTLLTCRRCHVHASTSYRPCPQLASDGGCGTVLISVRVMSGVIILLHTTLTCGPVGIKAPLRASSRLVTRTLSQMWGNSASASITFNVQPLALARTPHGDLSVRQEPLHSPTAMAATPHLRVRWHQGVATPCPTAGNTQAGSNLWQQRLCFNHSQCTATRPRAQTARRFVCAPRAAA